MLLADILGKTQKVLALIVANEMERDGNPAFDLKEYRFEYRWPNKVKLSYIDSKGEVHKLGTV